MQVDDSINLSRLWSFIRYTLAALIIAAGLAFFGWAMMQIGRKQFHNELLEGMRGSGERVILIYSDDVPTGNLKTPKRGK
jgi:hypothetical protein